jgi:hypothetical protein
MGRLEDNYTAIDQGVEAFSKDVLTERLRQEHLRAAGKFKTDCSDPCCPPHECLAVLAEEFGEASREVCEWLSKGVMSPNLEKELVQVAAVACAWWEGLQKAKRAEAVTESPPSSLVPE